MEPEELESVFHRHQNAGAQFLSFFLEGRGPVYRPYDFKEATIPFFGESYTQNGSDLLYRSLQKVMVQP
jgi:hypothetical protein